MKARFGLLSSIIMSFMTICFIVVGVWSATEHNFEVNGSIEYTAPTRQLYYEENDSYYVKMGTYNDTDVIWKCVGYIDSASGSTVTASTKPDSGQLAMFVQETYTLDHVFDTSGTNVYMDSDIRSYLIDTSSSGYKSALGISDSDYNQITARTGGAELSNANDKFWLVTYKEHSSVVKVNSSFDYTYWIRGWDMTGMSFGSGAMGRMQDGSTNTVSTVSVTSTSAVRAAFLLKI